MENINLCLILNILFVSSAGADIKSILVSANMNAVRENIAANSNVNQDFGRMFYYFPFINSEVIMYTIFMM